MASSTHRPENTAPGGMGGSTRMYDPSEAAHDRVRRGLMHIAFVAIALLNLAQYRWVGVHGGAWINVILLALASAPLGLAIKVFELRFKMASAQRQRLLAELPSRRGMEFAGYSLMIIAVFILNGWYLSWALWGIWIYDFLTYYHDRRQRMRHVYAVTMILDELRDFPRPWLWPLPALAWAGVQLMVLTPWP